MTEARPWTGWAELEAVWKRHFPQRLAVSWDVWTAAGLIHFLLPILCPTSTSWGMSRPLPSSWLVTELQASTRLGTHSREEWDRIQDRGQMWRHWLDFCPAGLGELYGLQTCMSFFPLWVYSISALLSISFKMAQDP